VVSTPTVVDLPAPFGPEQAEADPARHVEIDARERLLVAVALRERAHLDRG
jgi:hypothetical protein